MAINTLATETLFQRTLDKLAVQEAVTGWMDANSPKRWRRGRLSAPCKTSCCFAVRRWHTP